MPYELLTLVRTPHASFTVIVIPSSIGLDAGAMTRTLERQRHFFASECACRAPILARSASLAAKRGLAWL